MSTTIDSKVVEMRFDNKNFESNVATTMSTLQKLKQSLHLDGATKGMENISAAAQKVNLTPLSNAVESVSLKFSALEVAGITVISNLTNKAVNAGQRIASALTIDSSKAGFNEYELKMGSIQTIMASTGESLDVVNGYLNELNEYSDKTIYSFQDMTTNIGKFTNAGVKLEDAVLAIQGISNEAAVSGANANEASRAMYNFAQALSAGYVKLIDWKSIELANMATKEFKEQLIATAVAQGTLTKASDGMYKTLSGNLMNATKNFNDTLQDQWMTSDVLIETLKDYADETTTIGKKAFAAAKDVKTFSQMWDVLKESAQSGWAQTWETIVGDFEESKKFFTNLSEVFTGIIGKMADARNAFFDKALNSDWDEFIKKVEEAGVSAEDFSDILISTAKDSGIPIDDLIKKYGTLQEVIKAGKIPANIFTKALKKLTGSEKDLAKSTKAVTMSAEELEKVAKRVIAGEFGNGDKRMKALTEAGYDYAAVQNKVNELLGVSYRHTETLTEAQKKQADELAKLSDEQLKSKGYTDEQIKALRELEQAAEESGSSIEELIDRMSKPTGKFLLIEALTHIKDEIMKLFEGTGTVIGKWLGIEYTDLYSLIEVFHDFAMELEVSEDAAKRFKTIVEGMAAAFNLTHTVMSLSVLGGLKIFGAVLELMGTNILEVCEHISTYIIKLAEWVDKNTIWINTYEKIAKVITKVIEGVRDCVKAFVELEAVQNLVKRVGDAIGEFFGFSKIDPNAITLFDKAADAIENFFDRVEAWIKKLDLDAVFTNITTKAVAIYNTVAKVVSFFAKAFKTLYGIFINLAPVQSFINSLKVAFEELQHILAGDFDYDGGGKLSELFRALNEKIDFKSVKEIKKALESLFENVGKWLKSLEDSESFGKDFVVGIVNGLAKGVLALVNQAKTIAQIIFTTVCEVLEIHSPSKKGEWIGIQFIEGAIKGFIEKAKEIPATLKKIFQSAVDTLKQIDWGAVTAAAIALGSLFVLNKLAKVLNVIASPIQTFSTAMGALTDTFKATTTAIKIQSFMNIAIAIAILAAAIAALTLVDTKKMWHAVGAISVLAVVVGGLAVACLYLEKDGKVIQGTSIMQVALSLLVVAGALKLISTIPSEGMDTAIYGLAAAVGAIVGLLSALAFILKMDKGMNIEQAATIFLGMATAMLILVAVIKAVSGMRVEDVIKGIGFIAAVEMLFAAVIAVSYLAGAHASKAGGMLIKMSFAMLIMVAVIKLISLIKDEDIVRGLIAVAGIEAVFGAIIAVSWIAGKNATKAGGMLLLMAGAMLIMTSVIRQIAKIPDEDITRGLSVIGAISAIFMAIIAVSHFAGANADKAGVMLISMAGALAIVAFVITMLTFVAKDEKRLWTAVGAVSVVMLIMTGMIAAAKLAEASKTSLIVLTVAITILMGVLVGLTFIDPSKVKNSSQAIAIVIAAFAALVGVSKFAASSKGARKALAEMLAIVIVLVGVVALLSLFDSNSVIPNAIALSILLVAMSGAMLILSQMKATATVSLKTIGTLVALAVPLAAFAFILSKMPALQGGITNAIALSILVGAMALVLIPLSAVGATGMQALAGVGILFALSLTLIIFVGVLTAMDGLQNAMSNVLALSLLVGAMALVLIPLTLVGAFGVAGLIGVGTLLAMAVPMLTFVGILALMQNVENAKSNAQILIDLMTTMCDVMVRLSLVAPLAVIAVPAVYGLMGVITAFSVFAAAVAKLKDWFPGLFELIDTGIPLLVDIASGMGQIAGAFIGGIGIGMAEGLNAIAESLIQFMSKMMLFTMMVMTVPSEAIEGAKNLAEMILILTAAELVNNITSWLGGENDFAAFAEQLPSFGAAIAGFAAQVKGIDGESVAAAAQAGKALAEMADALPNTGGILQKLVGENGDMETFGTQLVLFGTALVSYANVVKGLDESATEAINTSVKASEQLINLADAIPNTGGIIAKLTGDNDISVFGTSIVSYANALIDFATASKELDQDGYIAIGNVVRASEQLIKMQGSLDSMGGIISWFKGKKDLKTFGKKLADFGESMSEYAMSISSISTEGLSSSTTEFERLADLAKGIKDLDTSGLSGFAEAFTKLGNSGINNFIKAFDNAHDKAAQAVAAMVKASIGGINEARSNFSTSGTNLVRGFANGITLKKYIAEEAARSMAAAAAEAAKEELDEHSPSRVGYEIGDYFGLGFVNAIVDSARSAYNASKEMAKSAKSGLSEAIGKAADLLNSDMDAQPTIRPVVDLSEVSAGAHAIGSMFGVNPSVGVLANVGSISSMMNSNQNGANNDIVSALKDLKSTLSNATGDTYQINGITYDDGTNVATAVGDLIRYARVERRA